MNNKTKEYLTDKFKQGTVTWDNGIYKLNKKDKVADEQGKLYEIAWYVSNRIVKLDDKLFSKIQKDMIKQFDLTSSKLEKHGCVRINYKTTKTSYSVFLREIKS
jgi:hypothetical protein